MIVRIFYNDIAFKNIVFVILKDDDTYKYEKKGNVCKLYNKENEVIGYNLEINDFKFVSQGYQQINSELLDKINAIIGKEFGDKLEHDFTPYIVVGKVLECEPHPDSDHMHICKVDVKDEVLQIVCGAANVDKGQKVVVCKPNAVLPNGKMISKGKLRGVESDGMLASAWELGLIPEKKKGILVLDDNYNIGDKFES